MIKMEGRWNDYFKLEIEVTRDDLDNGFRNKGEACPIALACIRAMGDDLIEIGVDGDDIALLLKGHENYKLSYGDIPFVREFVLKYDSEDYVSPFKKVITFNLRDDDYVEED